MPAKLRKLGKNTFPKAEIQQISSLGIWLYVLEEEYYLDFKLYPWFRKATIDQITNVELHQGKYLHWPLLDVDLELEALRYPEKYPLIYQD